MTETQPKTKLSTSFGGTVEKNSPNMLSGLMMLSTSKRLALDYTQAF